MQGFSIALIRRRGDRRKSDAATRRVGDAARYHLLRRIRPFYRKGTLQPFHGNRLLAASPRRPLAASPPRRPMLQTADINTDKIETVEITAPATSWRGR